jgi:uncharacterized repeat protein (TIGR01451 family)
MRRKVAVPFYLDCYWAMGKTFLPLIFIVFSFSNVQFTKAEGSGTWGTATDRQSWLWVPGSISGTSNYNTRGYMLLPSSTPNYNPDHRFYVLVKAGETVFYGFRATVVSSEIRVRWFYDNNDTGLFPRARTTAEGQVLASYHQYNATAAGGIQGRPADGNAAAIGPLQITGQGYNALSFTNTTGVDRVYWAEISNTSDVAVVDGFNINFWDVTVAAPNGSNWIKRDGRLYCKFWSIANSRPNSTQTTGNTSFSVTEGVANNASFHNDFGFYVPIDNTYTSATNDYFVKRIRFPGSSGGWTNFFANKDGTRSDLTYDENRKSLNGRSTNIQYPLFINNPDPTVWLSTQTPNATLNIVYDEKAAPLTGGEAFINVTIDLPAVVDILIDFNGNNTFDPEDKIISRNFQQPGTFQIYWDGKNANGVEVPSGSRVNFNAAVVFFPAHFPVFDLEQSLGIRVTNIRPGVEQDNNIFWDDSPIPRTGLTPANSPKSVAVNVTGLPSPNHIWHATGDNGFGNNMTINTWAAAHYMEVRETSAFLYTDITGNVFLDLNGMSDGYVNGDPIGFTGLQAVVVDQNNLAVGFGEVGKDGKYLINRIPSGTYTMVLTNIPATIGAIAPEARLPLNWENTGEFLGNGPGHDGTVDGRLPNLRMATTSLNFANFSIRPTSSDLEVTKAIDNDYPEVGSEVEFTITASNNGYSTATNVTVEEYLPKGYAYIEHSATSGVYDPIIGIWYLGDLVDGESHQLLIKATVTETEAYTNMVEIFSDSPDPQTDNNVASVTPDPVTILPVNWVFFRSKVEGRKVKLEWALAQDDPKMHFIVQRSLDGFQWEDMGDLVKQKQDVAFTAWDERPLSGKSYYRLVQIENASSRYYSHVVKVELDFLGEITVFPNPFKDQLFLYGLDLQASTLKLYDALGKPVAMDVVNAKAGMVELQLKNLPVGFYLLYIEQLGLRSVHKVIRN